MSGVFAYAGRGSRVSAGHAVKSADARPPIFCFLFPKFAKVWDRGQFAVYDPGEFFFFAPAGF